MCEKLISLGSIRTCPYSKCIEVVSLEISENKFKCDHASSCGIDPCPVFEDLSQSYSCGNTNIKKYS